MLIIGSISFLYAEAAIACAIDIFSASVTIKSFSPEIIFKFTSIILSAIFPIKISFI